MYEHIKNFHSGWAYLAIVLLVLAVVNSFIGMFSNKEFAPKDRKIALFGLIATHIQLVLGLIMFFAFSDGKIKLEAVNKIDHPYGAILAIVLITIGWSKHKKASDNGAKFKAITVFYGLGLLLILSRIPWSLWF
jgi:NADH:ubiquinone oxidoreductase subunit 2 (subunit N)